jgi:hypothetical protein
MSPTRLFQPGLLRSRALLALPLSVVALVVGACVPEPAPGSTTTTSSTTTTESTTTTSTVPTGPTVVGEACQPDSGVTVVVDFTALDDTVAIGCAPGEQASGRSALAAAGFVVSNDTGPAGIICTLDGLPIEGYPFCWQTGGYWGYWKAADRATAWDFSPVGADAGPLAEGSVEGWSWAPGFDGSAPRVTVADLADHTPLPVCEVPDAPVLSIIDDDEVLPLTVPGGGPIEVAVLDGAADESGAEYTEATSVSLSGRSGATRVLARSADEGCEVVDAFDAVYDVRATYTGRPGIAGSTSTARAAADAALVGWATGYTDYVPGADVSASFQTPANAVGPYSTSLVVLGNNGRITLTFDTPIVDGVGDDFAVFENGFTQNATSELLFTELAYVEVSSNGTDFVRFDSASRQGVAPGGFGFQDPKLLGGLAGKDPGGWGTVFDLAALTNDPAVRSGVVDLADIRYVRLRDVVGADDYPTAGDLYDDSFGRQILDAHPTTGSGGFDLRAVGVLNQGATG